MKITIFGLAGTGKTTVGLLLAKNMNYTFNSTGNLMRQNAKKLNMSIYEFDKLCKENTKYDIDLDKKVEIFGKENNNFIFESRLAWNFIPDSIKIKMICDETIAIKRIEKRENISFDSAKDLTNSRAKIVKERYNLIYPNLKFPPTDDEFDFVIDNTYMSIDMVLEKISLFLNSFQKNKK